MTKNNDIYEGASDIVAQGKWQFYGVDGQFYLCNNDQDISIHMDEQDAIDLQSVMNRAETMLTFGWNQDGDTLVHILDEKYNGSCPKCGSDHITETEFERDGDIVWHILICANCGNMWRDIYRFAFAESGGD